jgi:putative membrane protein
VDKRWTIFLAVLISLLTSCGGNGYYGGQGPWGWGPMMHYGYGGGIFMWILFLIVVVLLVYFIVQATKRRGQMPTQIESALDILKKRYAKGEITKEEFERMKKDLDS